MFASRTSNYEPMYWPVLTCGTKALGLNPLDSLGIDDPGSERILRVKALGECFTRKARASANDRRE